MEKQDELETHDIELLGIKAASYDSRFASVFFPDSNNEQRTTNNKTAFKLLKRAYIDARYKKGYRITKKQLEYLSARVKVLQKLTNAICKKKIESFYR